MFNAADKEVNGIGGVLLKQATPTRTKFWMRYPNLLRLNLLLIGALVCDVTNGYDQSMINGKLKLVMVSKRQFDPTLG